MLDKTILVIDVDPETEEKIVSTLEAEDYLVFAASGREITSGMAGKISPALIFLKPTANSVEGFEICKAIHNSEAFKNVPIIVLASLRGPLDARYTSFYGIVDSMEMPVSPGAIIEKTEKALGSKSHATQEPLAEEALSISEENESAEETPVTMTHDLMANDPLDHDPLDHDPLDHDPLDHDPLDHDPLDHDPLDHDPLDHDPLDHDPLDHNPLDHNPVDKELSDEESGQPSEDYGYRDEDESVPAGRLNTRRRRPRKSGLMVPVLLVTAAIAIVAGGFVSYKLFFPPAQVRVPVKAAAPRAVQQKTPLVVPSVPQQPKEEPVAEGKPTETKEALPQAPKQVSKQAAQKVPAAVPAVKPGVEPFYSVQLGAFTSEAGAEALAKAYKGKGQEAFIHKGTTKDNRPVYRVLIGKFKSRKEASRLAAGLQAEEKIKTTVFSEGLK